MLTTALRPRPQAAPGARESRPSSNVLAGLLLVAVVHGLLLNAVALAVRPDVASAPRVLALADRDRLLTANDSWGVMETAYDRLRARPAEPVYATLVFREGRKFQYPLTSLIPLQVANAVRPAGIERRTLLNALSVLAYAASLALLAAFAAREVGAAGRTAGAAAGLARPALAALLVLTLGLTFYPLTVALQIGQIQVWINAAMAGVLVCWLRGWTSAAGVLTGLACLIKPQCGLLLLWGLVRRQWAFALSGLAVAGAGALYALALFGVAQNLAYREVAEVLARRGEAFLPNQAVNGLLHRLLGNGDAATFRATQFPPFNPLVYAGTLASSAILIALALGWPWLTAGRARGADARGGDETRPGGPADLGIAMTTSVLASPIAWQHHFGVLFPVLLYLLLRAPGPPAFGRSAVPLLALAWLLVANDFFPLLGTPHGVGGALAGSYVLGGALLLLCALYAAVLRRRPAVPAG